MVRVKRQFCRKSQEEYFKYEDKVPPKRFHPVGTQTQSTRKHGGGAGMVTGGPGTPANSPQAKMTSYTQPAKKSTRV